MEYYSATKKEWNADTSYKMDEPQDCAELEKSVLKDYILCDSIYMKCPENMSMAIPPWTHLIVSEMSRKHEFRDM